MLGDIVGQPGRQAVIRQLPHIRQRWQPHLVIANAENAAHGSGLTPDQYHKLVAAGIHGITLGDHVYKRKEIVAVLEQQQNILRPANLPSGAKGRTWIRLQAVGDGLPELFVVTLLGRRFVDLPADDPFAVIDRILTQLPAKDPLVLVEMHAEATAEKQAMAWYLNGRVAAVLGSHTHVATADARLLPPPSDPASRAAHMAGTAYITDMGMCGPFASVIGRDIQPVLTHLTTAMHAPFTVAEGDVRVCGVFVEIDPGTRLARAIERIELPS